MKKVLVSAAVFAAALVPMHTASAAPPEVEVVNIYNECWDKGTTLWHVTLFNYTKERQVAYVTWAQDGQSHSDKYVMRKNTGVLTGIVVDHDSPATDVRITWNGSYIFYRTKPMNAAKRCM